MRSGFVALAGLPNAGKSTLLNALMKEKLAIVSDKPQTTRSQIRGILSLPDAQIVFTDTPGINKPHHRLESRMNREAADVIQGVDVVYLVVDGTVPFSKGDEVVLGMVKQAGAPVFLILNKVDRMSRVKVLEHLSSWQQKFEFAEFFPLSALEGSDFSDLIETTKRYLPEQPAMYPEDMVSDEPENFRIAEIIREKVLYCTEEEVPHATAVLVEQKEMEDEVCHISAVVLVEREGQKGILIGKQGSMLAKITALARKDISRLLGCKVVLNLFVRVESEWRDRDSRISEFGYGNTDE